VLGDDLPLKAGVAIPRDLYGQLTKVTLGSFLALGVAQVFGHLGLQGAFYQFLGEQLEQAVLPELRLHNKVEDVSSKMKTS
jgi:hypothetical protein